MSVFKYALVLLLFIGFSTISMADSVVATVNGKKFTKSQFDHYLKYREATSRQDLSKDKEGVLQELINRYLLMQQVKKKKIDSNPNLRYLVQQGTEDLYIKALLRTTDVAKPVPDSEIKKIYDEKVKGHTIQEYKIRVILMKTEKAAKAIIKDLNGGADFAKLAKEKSTGPSAKQGGEIGWLSTGELHNMPGFAKALSELKKGEYTKTPIKTQYGWNIAKLEDARTEQPPDLNDDIRRQIVEAVRQKRLAEYVKSLRDKAKIHIKLK